MQSQAISRFIRVSPRKMTLLATSIKSKRPDEALAMLKNMHKSGSSDLYKTISSAIANARVKNLDTNTLEFKEVSMMSAGGMKRFMPVSRGMAHTYKKRMSHIRVVLTNEISNNQISNDKQLLKSQKSNLKSQTKSKDKDSK